jgi:hypothetical protein
MVIGIEMSIVGMIWSVVQEGRKIGHLPDEVWIDIGKTEGDGLLDIVCK